MRLIPLLILVVGLSATAVAEEVRFSAWTGSCSYDEIRDLHECEIQSTGEKLSGKSLTIVSLVRTSTGSNWITLASQSDPRIRAVVRVDQNDPVRLETIETMTPTLRQQMRAGESMLVETQQWPTGSTRFRIDLTGFTDADTWLYERSLKFPKTR